MVFSPALRRRIEALEAFRRTRELAFGGMLEFDGHTETPDDAAKRAPGPGLYFVLNRRTDEGHACEVAADGQFTIINVAR